MKRTFVLTPAFPPTASVFLTLCLLVAAGCSERPAAATGEAQATPNDLTESEVADIKKTAKNQKAFMEAFRKKTLEKEGVLIPTKTSRKGTNRPR